MTEVLDSKQTWEDLLETLRARAVQLPPWPAPAGDNIRAALKFMGDLVERRYPGVGTNIERETGLLIDRQVEAVLRSLASELWSGSGIGIAPDAPVHAGGFSWILKVDFGGRVAALAIPKFTSEDYQERIATRHLASQLVREDIGFSIPRTLAVFEQPVPSCLMTYVEGENCYPRTFDKDGNFNQQAMGAGNEVFNELGKMARGFTSVTGDSFGPITKPPHRSAPAYIQSYLAVIEPYLASISADRLQSYQLSKERLETIVEWVRSDAELQTTSHLVHGDLSPWNLIHEPSSGTWTITDGDDSRFGIFGEQIGVCLNSMRGNFNREWIEAIAKGFGYQSEAGKRDLLLRGAAYGVVTYGLPNAAKPLSEDEREKWEHIALHFLAPCVRLFCELG